MVALANVQSSDTFDNWRTRTNQIIIKLDQLETSDGASFNKANAANVLAFNTGIGANAFTSATIAGANTAVGTGANSYAAAIGTAANSYMITTQNGANTAVGTGANAYAAAIGTAGNTYLLATISGANSAVGTGANSYAAAIGTAANSYMITTQNGSNTAVGTGANAFTSATIAGANTYLLATIAGANTAIGAGANTVGSAAFNRANSTVISIIQDTVNVTRYIPFIDTTSGNTSTLNVSTSHLSFNPSSNTLTTNNMYLLASLGVGTSPSGTVGEIRATDDITAYYSSDISLKTNIDTIPDALNKIMQIRGVGFDWKDSYINERGGEDGYFVRRRDVGIIAQEIEKVLPEVVASRENGIKAVKYEKLIALLIEAIKELNNKIERK